MLRYRKTYPAVIAVILLSLGLAPQSSQASSTPLSAPVVPAQNVSAAVPADLGETSSQKIEVMDVQGTVSVQKRDGGDFQTIQNGTVVHPDESIKTEEGSCRLLVDGDGRDELYVGPGTVLKITEALRRERDKTHSTVLTLESGKLRVKLAKLKKGSDFEVRTPTAIAVVRGTVFYLNVGIFLGQNSTQLYVDESHGGVAFQNTATGESFIIPAFSLSTSFADGKLSQPQELTPEQQDTFVKNWEKPGSSANQQFGIEEIPNPPPGAAGQGNLPDQNTDAATNDAAQDRVSEQNIPGSNGFEPSQASQGGGAGAGPSLDDQERAMIREEIARIRADQDFDHADANLAQISDAQTGKVFTDVFGNRVRVDQYIFHEPDSDTVQFLSLTARTGAYQNGVSAVLFGTQFNHALGGDVDLKSLPWNDYLRVVKREDVAANLGIPRTILVPGPGPQDPPQTVDNPVYDALFDEYIVHENAPGLTEGLSPLFPKRFFAEITDPVGGRSGSDRIRFEETYTDPFSIDLQTGEGLQSFRAQGKATESTLVQPLAGDKILIAKDKLADTETISINDGPTQAFSDNQNNNNQNDDGGSQTTSFKANFDPSKLLDINFYRNLAQNNDGNPDNDEHPAYFDDRLNDRLGANNVFIGQNHLIGGFVPIDDQGHIIDQPGFRVRGLRDVLSPNPLVNGGNYNLEMVFLYGYVDGQDSLPTDLFHEDFRIDVIITPEIFQNFGAGAAPSSIFPPALHADDDDTSSV